MSEVKVLDNGNVLLTVPISLRFRAGRKRLIFQENDSLEIDPLAMNLARLPLAGADRFGNVQQHD